MRDLLVSHYRPDRPSVWRDLAALDLLSWRTVRAGLPVLAGLALVPVFSLLLECFA